MLGIQSFLNDAQANNDADYAARMAEVTGTDIKVAPIKDADVNGQIEGNQITISDTATEPFREIVKHEIAHRTQDLAPGNFERYIDSQRGDNFDAAVEQHRRVYESKNRQADDVVLQGEVAADMARNFIKDVKGIERVVRLAERNPSMLDRVHNVMKDFTARIKTIGGKKFVDSTTGNVYSYEDLRRYEKLYEYAIARAARRKDRAGAGEVRNAIRTDNNGNPFVEIDDDILDGVRKSDRTKVVKEFLKNKFSEPIFTNNGAVTVNSQSGSEFTYSRYTTKIDNATRVDKFKMANNLDEIIKIQNNVTPEPPAHPRNDNFVSFERGYADVKVGKNGYTADVVIGIRRSGKKVFYDLVNLIPKNIDAAPHKQVTMNEPIDTASAASNTDSIPRPEVNVKRNSLKRDIAATSNNITHSRQFKRWFGDWDEHTTSSSAVVNEDGTPKIVYRGTPRDGFTEFDSFGGLSQYRNFNNSPYFTESRSVADSYTKNGIDSKPELYEVYLNIRNPIDMDAPAEAWKWNKILRQYKYATRAEKGKTNGDVYRALEKEIENKTYWVWEKSAQHVVECMGYDGITHIKSDRDSGERHRVWIAFKPDQVISAASKAGTFGLIEPDIRYSLKRDNPATEAEEKHTTEQLKIMREYEAAVDNDILEFAKYARANPKDNRTSITISEVTPKAAEDIQRLTGIDVEGFDHSIKTNTIHHIDKRHGVSGASDHSMADDNDIARIQYVLDNYDNIELLTEKSSEYRDKNQSPAPMVKYSKRVDGTYYVVEAVPDTRKHQLAVITAYKPVASAYKKKR